VDFLNPMVLPVDLRPFERLGSADFYVPDDGPRPAVIIVHGGPLPAELEPKPRDWPVYRAYGSLLAQRGVVGVTVGHRLHSPADYPTANQDVHDAVEAVRADPRVDADRVALWFFSGGGMLSTDWLLSPPSWLRCLALTYPLVAPPEGWPVDPHFRPIEAVTHAGDLPIVLTRVGLERPDVAVHVDEFATVAAKGNLHVIDVPNGRHSFDNLDDTDESRDAITSAITAVLARL
jgi:acetyl esterase/lipase